MCSSQQSILLGIYDIVCCTFGTRNRMRECSHQALISCCRQHQQGCKHIHKHTGRYHSFLMLLHTSIGS